MKSNISLFKLLKYNSNENDENDKKLEEEKLLEEEEKLKKIKIESENKYRKNIKNNIIEYIKKNDNNITYNNWLKSFNKLDWELEFNNNLEKRGNKIYHEIWDNITKYNEYVLIY